MRRSGRKMATKREVTMTYAKMKMMMETALRPLL
jgi:hypothetical protein